MRTISVFTFGFYILCFIDSITCGTVFKTILKEGTGPVIKPNQTAVVHYNGTLQSGVQFDSSHDRNEPFEFVLGNGQVIPGWDAGVATMKVGERAQLEIAPEDAYGAAGIPPTIPPSATLLFDIELIAIKGRKSNPEPGPPLQVQPGRGATQPGSGMPSIPQTDQSTSFQPGSTGLGIGQQSLSRPGMGFPGGTQPDSMSQFFSGISPPGLLQPGSLQRGGVSGGGTAQTQGTSLSSSLDLASQGQRAVPPGSAAGNGMPSSPQGIPPVPNQGGSPNIVDLATQGQGFTFGNQDFSSQILDLSSGSQQFPSQSQNLPGSTGGQQSVDRQNSQGSTSGNQSWRLPSSQNLPSQPGMGSGTSQFQSIPGFGSSSSGTSSNSQFQNMPGFVGSSGGQSPSFDLQNTFGNSVQLGRDPPMNSFGQMTGSRSSSVATGQPGVLTPPGLLRNGLDARRGNDALGGMLNRQPSFGGADVSQRLDAARDRPLRMNTDQPRTQMEMLGRRSPFGAERPSGQGMAGTAFGTGQGFPGMPRSADGRGMGRTIGIGGLRDTRGRGDGRGMIDIMRRRGMPFGDPRSAMDPRFRGMPPGPPRFPAPPMPPRGGMPPFSMMERLRMLRRLRGF